MSVVRAWRLGSSLSSVLAAFLLLLPGMSLTVYMRAHTESFSIAQTCIHNHCKYPSNGLCMHAPSLSPSFLTKERHMRRQPLSSNRGSRSSVRDSTASDNVSKGMHETYGIIYTALWCHSGMTATMRKKSKQKALFYTCSANGENTGIKKL